MSSSPQHLFHFEGGNALSAFRAQALLPRLQAVQPRISAVHARHVHWVWSDHPLARAEHDKLEALLRGLGCGYIPETMVRNHLDAGRLVARRTLWPAVASRRESSEPTVPLAPTTRMRDMECSGLGVAMVGILPALA